MARVFISHSSRDNDAAARIKTWLESEGFEAPFLDFDKHAGIAPGSDWEQVLYREIDRSEAMIIVQTPHWLDSKWCFAEFTQARALGKPIFPIIETPTGDRLISPDIQALDLTKDTEGGLTQLSEELTRIAMDAQGGFAWDATRAPYPGLLAFQEEDAAIYFGRDDDNRRLIERLNARRAQGGARLIALLGASGSGKSSLMRAGVIPRLKRSGRHWVVAPTMRPQARPMGELARSLAVAAGRGTEWRAIREGLRGDDIKGAFYDLAADIRMAADAPEATVLLPVDQAEEAFGASDPDEAKAFLTALSVMLADDLPYMAMFAMRSDFLGQLQAAAALSARYEEFSLGPMPVVRIPQIIEGPARVAGLGLDDSFVQQAARDAETEDALPLLAFALRELYDTAADDNYLSHDEYTALGDQALGLTPLENAVRRAADHVLADAAPGPEDLAALRDAFVPDMVRINDQGEYVRQPARMDQLPARAHALLEKLANARLLIIRQEDDVRTVEVAHEALLRKWPKLRGWLDDAREFLSGRQQMALDMHDWEHASEAAKPQALLTGLKLTRAQGWLTEYGGRLKDDERAFIRASIDHATAKERRRARNRRITTIASVAAAVVMAVFAGFAVFQWFETQRSHDQRLEEQISFVWQDLGSESAEIARLRNLAETMYTDVIALNLERNASLGLRRSAREMVGQPQKTPHPDGFDCTTWLERGFRSLYCSIRSVVSLEKLQTLSGLRVFQPGSPHDDELDFKASSFGRYNPEFLDWLDQVILPDGPDDLRVNDASRVVYEVQLGPLIRALYRSHKILYSDAERFERFTQIHKDMCRLEYAAFPYTEMSIGQEINVGIFSGRTPVVPFADMQKVYARFLETGDKTEMEKIDLSRHMGDYLAYVHDEDWYLADTAVSFWVRRETGGSADKIHQLLEKTLAAFEPEVLTEDPLDVSDFKARVLADAGMLEADLAALPAEICNIPVWRDNDAAGTANQ